MRLDRYLPEQQRLRADSRRQKLLVVGIVIGIHLFLAAGWTAFAAIRERNAPPREVIRYFDISDFPAPLPVAPPAKVAEPTKVAEPANAPAAPARPSATPTTPSDPARQ
jgi:hypothetical protein